MAYISRLEDFPGRSDVERFESALGAHPWTGSRGLVVECEPGASYAFDRSLVISPPSASHGSIIFRGNGSMIGGACDLLILGGTSRLTSSFFSNIRLEPRGSNKISAIKLRNVESARIQGVTIASHGSGIVQSGETQRMTLADCAISAREVGVNAARLYESRICRVHYQGSRIGLSLGGVLLDVSMVTFGFCRQWIVLSGLSNSRIGPYRGEKSGWLESGNDLALIDVNSSYGVSLFGQANCTYGRTGDDTHVAYGYRFRNSRACAIEGGEIQYARKVGALAEAGCRDIRLRPVHWVVDSQQDPPPTLSKGIHEVFS